MIRFADTRLSDKELHKEIKDILLSGIFINGGYTRTFADEWARYCNANFCVPVDSGSAALIASLKAASRMGTDKKEVIIPTFSFAATAFAVLEAGFSIVYCPVDKQGLIDQEVALKIVKSRPILAVIPVHLYGQVIEIDQEFKLHSFVIEDACQAHGTKLQGDIACFSFYPSKNLGAAGDAGAVITDNRHLASHISAYINYGDYPGEKYVHSIEGNNLRMDEIQAAVLLYRLKTLDENNHRRSEIVQEYRVNGVESFANQGYHHLFPILSQEPDALSRLMFECNIQTGRHYPYALPDIAPGNMNFVKNDNSRDLARKVITLPIGPHLSNQDVAFISANLIGLSSSHDNIWRVYSRD